MKGGDVRLQRANPCWVRDARRWARPRRWARLSCFGEPAGGIRMLNGGQSGADRHNKWHFARYNQHCCAHRFGLSHEVKENVLFVDFVVLAHHPLDDQALWSAQAAFYLGVIYQNSNDYQKSAQFYKRSYDLGFVDALAYYNQVSNMIDVNILPPVFSLKSFPGSDPLVHIAISMAISWV